MVLFKKIRPRRGSLAVSIIWGSPIAAKSRSAALAYRIGSPRQDSRYSAIDISVSLRAPKDRAKALNRGSLYIILLPNYIGRISGAATLCSRHQQRAHSIAYQPLLAIVGGENA